MEIDCGINCFSAELYGSLRVNHHCPGLFSDCTDHSFSNTILMMYVWRALLVCSTAGREDIPEGLIVVFYLSIIAPLLLNFVSH